MVSLLAKKKSTNLFVRNKKSEGVVYPIIIFVILNLAVFSILLLFVNKSSTGALIYEQFYAKQIALLVDGANFPSVIVLNFEDGIKVSEKNKATPKVTFNGNRVNVKLSDKGAYSFGYISNREISSYFDFEQNVLVIVVE